MDDEKSGVNLAYAKELLDSGQIIGIPTETVYGLAANGFDPDAIIRIFDAKKRPYFDPLILHIGQADQLQLVAKKVPQDALKLAQRFWPGPLTIILEKSDRIPDLVSSGLPTVGIRIPRHPITLDLLGMLDYPLAAPSANPFGYISPTSAGHVLRQLGDLIPYVIDGGMCSVGVESTIVDLSGDQPVMRRLGAVTNQSISEALGKPVLEDFRGGSNPAAPGLLAGHYAPRKPLYFGDIEALLDKFGTQKVAVLGYTQTYGYPGIALSPGGSINEAARNLFAAMRKLDESNYEIILAETMPHKGIGRAMNDRLQRASR